MKLQLDPLIAAIQTIPGAAPQPEKSPEPLAPPGDGIHLSRASTALNRRPDVARLTAAVQSGSYQTSSAATSSAIVEDALSSTN